MSGQMLVFDMDGVLVDPTATFRRALIETAKHFAGVRMTQDDIVRIKNGGGYNNDFDLAMHVIRQAGTEADSEAVMAFGRDLYWGTDGDGLIRNERWLVRPGVLERLAASRPMGIFTGRGRQSALHTLNRFCPEIGFDPIITNERVENQKPAPDGLLAIRSEVPGAELVYVGDNVDDGQAARDAGVRFVGIVAPETPRHEETRALLEELGAEIVLESINELEAWLA